jgi:FKBP-type peptidyl-prolyl cis-trans isomerase SlyD
MKITKDTVVAMNYLLTNGDGVELDRSEEGSPLVYLHGSGQIVPGLERQLEGLSQGERREKIEVAPGEAYGEMKEELMLSVSRQQFPPEAEIEPGMRFWANTPEGEQHPFTVIEVEGDEVKIDGNHPLAGQTLYFDVTIDSVRVATKEELDHGHAHGPGGHHH